MGKSDMIVTHYEPILKLIPMNPRRAERELAALLRLYSEDSTGLFTQEAYERKKREILLRVMQ